MADLVVLLRPINLVAARMAAHLGLPVRPAPMSNETIPEPGLASERSSNAPAFPDVPGEVPRAARPAEGESR